MALKDLNVIEWGIIPNMPFELSRKIRLVNVFALIASSTTLPYVFIFTNDGIQLWLPVLIYFLGLTSPWFLNKKGKYHLAKILLYVFSHLYLFTAASALGKASGEHMILIPVIFSAILLFEAKEKFSMLFVVLLNVATFLILELTDFSLYSINLSEQAQQNFYYGSLFITLFASITVAAIYFHLYGLQIKKNRLMIETGREIEQTINYFSTSLFGQNSVDEILWDVAKNCIGRLGFVDCVIYLLDEEKELLIQKAAYGRKNPSEFEIFKPINIPMGKGIVGHVARTAQPLIVNDTSKDQRYIPDEEPGLSEIAVPLIYNGKVIGVIDSEHPDRHFFTQRHLNVLRTISSLCANKVAKAMAEREREKALKVQMEAEKIKAFDDLKSKLFANISHELRTPLTLIMGTIDKHIKEDSQGDWNLLKIHTDRLLRLINQILDLTKLESGQFKLHPKVGDVKALLRLTITLFHPTASLKNVSIKENIGSDQLWLNFDRDALEKIVFNLLSNAIKFTAEGSVVEIHLTYKKQILKLCIKDAGEGISAEEQDKIFDRFYQAGKKSSEGTGIGLALTKELVELHQGTIKVKSTIGEGSEFTVQLPLQVAKSKEINRLKNNIAVSVTPPHPRTTKICEETGTKSTVLVVEDNIALADFIKSELEPLFIVISAHNGEKGMDLAVSELPDLIITDIMMPRVDGYELSNQLKENELTSHIPIIMLTARADMESKLSGLQIGADDYMVKPFNAEELRIRVTNLLDTRKRLRKKYSQLISLGTEEIVVSSADEVFIKKIMVLIEENLDNSEFGVQSICKKLGISRMQLHRKLTALTGQSTTTFIRIQKLNHASRMLVSGEAVSQVAYAVGFSSLSYFSSAFKEQFGIRPSEYTMQKI